MAKEDVVCQHTHMHKHTPRHTGVLATEENETLPLAATWMNLENIMVCEIKSERQILYRITSSLLIHLLMRT